MIVTHTLPAIGRFAAISASLRGVAPIILAELDRVDPMTAEAVRAHLDLVGALPSSDQILIDVARPEDAT